MKSASNELISAIRITNLFGLYSYSLPEEGVLSNASILYGDNGAGKSTVLRLAFHLLSSAGNRGHRSALCATIFEKLEIDLASGVTVSATRNANQEIHILSLKLLKDREILAAWDYAPKNEDGGEDIGAPRWDLQFDPDGTARLVVNPTATTPYPKGEKAYLSALEKHTPAVFILNAERRLDSDSIADPRDEVELRQLMMPGSTRRINDLVARSREIGLSQAMNTASKWIGRKAVAAANQGSVNVHTVYLNVMRHLIAEPRETNQEPSTNEIEELVARLSMLESRTLEFSKYEFEMHLPTKELSDALLARKPTHSQIIANLLKPYIESSEGRLTALDSIYRITDGFVSTVNKFLTDKTITYTLSHGLEIKNKLGFKLEPAQLSSGEQQLLLLFCYVLAWRDHTSIFMIDEPEISLNIKWQRQLVQALLDITRDVNIQFIFASHSMELLAQHRQRVIPMRNTQ